MRSSSLATTLAVLTAGLTAGAVLHRRAGRPVSAAAPAIAPGAAIPDTDGVVLPFVRPVAAVPAPLQAEAPVRCGDAGGRTKAGAPCAARATTAGRCHHHRLAA
jgi:hypothetical protein